MVCDVAVNIVHGGPCVWQSTSCVTRRSMSYMVWPVNVVDVVCDVVRDVIGTERRGRDGALLSIRRPFENPNVGPQPSGWKGGTRRSTVHSRHEVRVL